MPAMPHTPSDPADRTARRARDERPDGLRENAQVETDGAIGDPLEVVGELLGPGHLTREAELGETRDPRPDDEPLPVRRDLLAQVLEERGADRARPDQAHISDQHVPE